MKIIVYKPVVFDYEEGSSTRSNAWMSLLFDRLRRLPMKLVLLIVVILAIIGGILWFML